MIDAQIVKWISVEERLPDSTDGERVLYYAPIGDISDWDKPMDLIRTDDFSIYYRSWGITHWMSLPDVPKENKE